MVCFRELFMISVLLYSTEGSVDSFCSISSFTSLYGIWMCSIFKPTLKNALLVCYFHFKCRIHCICICYRDLEAPAKRHNIRIKLFQVYMVVYTVNHNYPIYFLVITMTKIITIRVR